MKQAFSIVLCGDFFVIRDSCKKFYVWRLNENKTTKNAGCGQKAEADPNIEISSKLLALKRYSWHAFNTKPNLFLYRIV